MSSTMNQSPSREGASAPIASTIDLLGVLWRRRTAWIVGFVVALVGGVVLYLVTPDQFESQTAVLLVQKSPRTLPKDGHPESGFEAFLATHRALIVSPLIVENAIETANLRSLKMFSDLDPEEDLVDYIIADLEAGNAGRELGENADSIMTLTYRGTDPEECPRVVKAIVESYKAFLDDAYRGMSDEVVRLVDRARNLLEKELKQLEDDYIAFRQQSPLVSKGTDEVNPLQERLTAIDARRSTLMLLRTRLQAQLDAIEKAQREGVNESQMVALIADVRRHFDEEDPFVTTANGLDAQLVQLADREQQLLELYGPKHPHVMTVRRRIEALRQLQALPTTVHVSEVRSEADTPSPAVGEIYARHLRETLQQIETADRLLRQLYDREHAQAKALAAYQLRDERFQREIARTEQLYDEVIQQLQEASLVKGMGGYEARVIAPPREGEKVAPSLKIYGAASILIGLLLGTMLAVGWELLDWLRRSQAVTTST